MHDRLLAIANSGELSEQTANELRKAAGEVERLTASHRELSEACEAALSMLDGSGAGYVGLSYHDCPEYDPQAVDAVSVKLRAALTAATTPTGATQ